jgi:hypothetical protein
LSANVNTLSSTINVARGRWPRLLRQARGAILSIGKKRKRIERLGVDTLRSLDDEEMAAALDFVRRAGWTVRSDQEALELYRRHAAERAPPRERDR